MKTCKNCYAAKTGAHPMSGQAHGCTLGYKTDGQGHALENCPENAEEETRIKAIIEREKAKNPIEIVGYGMMCPTCRLKYLKMKDISYEFDRPLLRTEKGDIVEISVTHFVKSIVKEKDIKKYGHIPNGIYRATVVEPYKLECNEYPELSGYYNYWRGDKSGCSDGIYANEVGKSKKMFY